MRKFMLLCLLVVGLSNYGFAVTPEVLLDEYANHILKQDFVPVGGLFDAESRTSIKEVMDKALCAEIKKGRTRLQQSILGKRIKSAEIESISADTYITGLLGNFLSSTQSQGFSFERYKLLGRVDESDDLAHLVFRTFGMGQESGFDNVQIYSFSRSEDGWGMITPPILKQMLLMIESGSQR
jgi:hypothetical protein